MHYKGLQASTKLGMELLEGNAFLLIISWEFKIFSNEDINNEGYKKKLIK